jgi:hypothetical protein
MGGLIMTKGTRRLMNWYNNHCFDQNSLPQVRQKILQNPGNGLYSLFATPAGNMPVIQQITHNPAGAQIFLPPYDPQHHPHLLIRWDYYLGSILTNVNHELLRGYLWNAINNGLTAVRNDPYTAIVVDCVEGNIQTVLQADEYLLDANGNLDPSTAYSHITLITQAMSTQLPVPIDPQFPAAFRRRRRAARGRARKAAKKVK